MARKAYIAVNDDAPPLEGYETVRTIDVDVDPGKLQPGETERDSKLATFLQNEILSFHEANNVFEDFKRLNPDRMTAWEINELLLKIRGKGWGVWKHRDNIAGLSLTTADMIDQQTLMACYVDQISIHQWYINYRKKRLKACIRYAEQPNFTIQQLQAMNEKAEQEMIASVPPPIALATQAKVMIKEADARPDQITDLLNKTLAAKEALFAAMNDLGETVHGFKKTTDDYSKDLHAFKASVILDLGAAKKEMADVRKFFLEKEHVTEIDRLKEFLDLCDRFKKLKDEGVLDVITDCILKLEGA